MDILENADTDTLDSLLHDLGGCGRYQFVVSFSATIFKIVSALSMMFMAFGNYNPGWECMDNSTATDSNLTNTSVWNSGNLTSQEKCQIFESCDNVQYTPGIYTIVTEWQLSCNRAWIPSLIISVQMAGVLVGSYLSGYLGDKIGRKSTMYGFAIYHIVVNVIAIFSNSWQMFAVVRFFIGLAIAVIMNMPVVLSLELVPYKWRNVIICFPAWAIGCILFTVSAMVTQDWRYIHGIIAVSSLICLAPCYWMPESLRWLVVKNKMKRAVAVVKNISSMNGKDEQGIERVQRIGKTYKSQTSSNDHSFRHLMKKGFRKPTIIIGIVCISMSMIYYSIGFGVKSLPGNIYTNMFIMYASEIPIALLSSNLPNYIGRKISSIVFLILATACLFIFVILDRGTDGSLRTIGSLVSVMTARVTVDASWDVAMTYTGEYYPTVIRSTSFAYCSLVARIGGILAPYLIPNEPDVQYINYLIMALLGFICSGLLFILPDLKGQTMRDTWTAQVPNPKDCMENGNDESTDRTLNDNYIKNEKLIHSDDGDAGV